MAGIYIKGMQMPGHCGYCRFRYDGICHVLQKTQYTQEDCPLVPVPDHGDLIDRDVMLQEIKAFRYGNGNGGYTYASKAPTVIPADREGEA